MGLTAEKVAMQWKISRQAQDEFAHEPHRRAHAAQLSGECAGEIIPIDVIHRVPNLSTGQIDTHTQTITNDEGVRPATTLEVLGKLKPVFAAKGSVAAGNSSQTSDGAGVLIIVSEKILKQFNLVPLARFVSFAVRGVPPEIMGIGPKEAIPAALASAGLTLNHLDWIKLNEAFAAQALAASHDLGLDMGKVNPLGDTIVLGHPLGATGAIRAATVIHGMRNSAQIRHGDDVRRYGHGCGRYL